MSNRISDDELDMVSGGNGGIFNASDISGSDHNKPWEVLDNHGNVKGRYSSRDEALFNAGRLGVDGFGELNWDQVQNMRR